MSEENLPNKIDPFRFADNAIRLEGVFYLKEMKRLSESLSSNDGRVNVTLEFGIDESKARFLRGTFSTQLMLQCQRCTESFAYEITDTFLSGIVHTEEEAKELPSGYDPLIVKEGLLSLLEVVEDELIIGLPIVPLHRAGACKVKMPYELGADSEKDKDNPFKVIELLRKTNRNSS